MTANNTTNFGGNPVAYYTNADNISTGTVPSARVSGSYSGITNVGTLLGVAVTGNSNFDSGVLFVDGTNNRVGINNTTPDAALTVTGSANVSGDLTVTGNFIISGNVTSTGNTVSTGDFLPVSNGFNLGNTISRWDLFGVDIALSNTISISTINTTANGVFANNTTLVIGNSSVNASINSTAFSGTANNSTNLNGQPASFYVNGTNITTGTVAAARLPAANDTTQGAVIIVNSVSNTSITATASANNVKTAYDAAIAANTRAASAQTAATAAYTNAIAFSGNAAQAYTNAVTFASSATNISSGTVAAARLPAANDTTQGAVIIVNSISNTSITATAAANNVKTAYDAAISANTRAASAQTAATSAYSNAVTFASNGDNISSGTVASARLPAANDIAQGAVIIVNSVTSTSITATATANNVKTAYDAAIAANTRATSAQTAAVDAYSNAVTFASSATNITTGTLAAARLTGSYTGITGVGTLVGVAVTGNSNFDSGVLFIDGTNNRVGVNTTSPSVTLQISSNDAIFIPVGNTNQRPSGANGMLRYNGELNTFEGYANSAWGEVGGSGGGYYKGNLGAIGKSTNKDNIYRINSNTQSNNVTIAAGENALTAGPIVIAEGFNLTVEEGGRAVII